MTELLTGSQVYAGEMINHRSLDKRFAIRIVESANAEPRVELIALPSRNKVIKLDPRLAGSGVALDGCDDARAGANNIIVLWAKPREALASNERGHHPLLTRKESQRWHP